MRLWGIGGIGSGLRGGGIGNGAESSGRRGWMALMFFDFLDSYRR